MDKKQDVFDKLVARLKKQQPVIADRQKLTDDIMQQIHNRQQKKQLPLSYSIIRNGSVAAAVFLLIWLGVQELSVSNYAQEPLSGYFIELEDKYEGRCKTEEPNSIEQYLCYVKTKNREKEVIKNLINQLNHETNN